MKLYNENVKLILECMNGKITIHLNMLEEKCITNMVQDKTLQSSPRAHAIYFRYTIKLSAVLFVDNSVISLIIVSDMCKLALLFTTGKQIYKPVVILL